MTANCAATESIDVIVFCVSNLARVKRLLSLSVLPAVINVVKGILLLLLLLLLLVPPPPTPLTSAVLLLSDFLVFRAAVTSDSDSGSPAAGAADVLS